VIRLVSMSMSSSSSPSHQAAGSRPSTTRPSPAKTRRAGLGRFAKDARRVAVFNMFGAHPSSRWLCDQAARGPSLDDVIREEQEWMSDQKREEERGGDIERERKKKEPSLMSIERTKRWQGKEVKDAVIGRVPISWVSRIIGWEGNVVKKLEEMTGASFNLDRSRSGGTNAAGNSYKSKAHGGSSSGSTAAAAAASHSSDLVHVKVRGPEASIEQAVDKFEYLCQLEHLRDHSSQLMNDAKHRFAMEAFQQMRRITLVNGLCLSQSDYNLFFALCGHTHQMQLGANVFDYMCREEKDCTAAPRTWTILCRSAVSCGDVRQVIDRLDLAVEGSGVSDRQSFQSPDPRRVIGRLDLNV
jgi:hypothetical protein